MLQFHQLSYWEKSMLTEQIDYLVTGSGIVGAATALKLRELYPEAKIVILDRGYVPTGASTKNAGFACFGSVTELTDDLSKMDAHDVWSTVDMRWRGLQRLQERFPGDRIGMRTGGSWDLVTENETASLPELKDQLAYLNAEVARITGQSDCFSYDKTIGERAGFSGIHGGFYNSLEGEIHTGRLMLATHELLAKSGVISLFGIEVLQIEPQGDDVLVETNFGTLKTAKLAVTVNGFAQQLLGDARIQPARAQVVVTAPISGFELPGTFHYQKGYYYFRSVDHRLLIGGGRNLDTGGETTTDFGNTDHILQSLRTLVDTTIFPGKNIPFDYQWSGIMGVGSIKKPIVELIHPHVGIGVRMGGMGVAIGSLVGEELAELLN
jgi:gamma-glutamylputrescine oxidase